MSLNKILYEILICLLSICSIKYIFSLLRLLLGCDLCSIIYNSKKLKEHNNNVSKFNVKV